VTPEQLVRPVRQDRQGTPARQAPRVRREQLVRLELPVRRVQLEAQVQPDQLEQLAQLAQQVRQAQLGPLVQPVRPARPARPAWSVAQHPLPERQARLVPL
jgi:hypothetical protein